MDVLLSLQRQTIGLSCWVLYISTLVLWFTGGRKCSSYLQSWYGLVS